jgi:hypothetical protein
LSDLITLKEILMRAKTFVLGLAVIALLINSSVASARQAGDPPRQWASLTSIRPGAKLSVRLRDGKKVEGRFGSVSDTVLTISREGATLDLGRESVAKIYQKLPKSVAKSTGKSALIGAGVGFGVGAGVGIAGGSYEDLETAQLVGWLGGLGAAIGAGVGALVGAISGSGDKRVLVYESN